MPLLHRLKARRLAGAVRRLHLQRWRRSASNLASPSPSVGRIWTSGQWIATAVDSTATPAMQPARNYGRVRDALKAHGVHHVVVSHHPMRPYVVAVAEEDWDQAVRAISASLAGRAFYAQVPARTWRGRKVADYVHVSNDDFTHSSAEASKMSLFEATQQAPGSRLLGAESAVTVQRWAVDEAGNLRHGGTNDVGSSIDPLLFRSTIVENNELGVEVSRLDAASVGAHERCQFPIDLVYMWVDGEDPVWQEQRQATLQVASSSEAKPDDTATWPWLFRDRDELMYSLRSVEECLPWVRTIHLVTDGQVPVWLDTDNSRLRLHAHAEFFGDPAALPTFNSHAIGSQLHRLPGLAEHYLVMNDDVLFGAPLEPEQFFTPSGLARVRPSRHHAPVIDRDAMSAIESARQNAVDLVEQLHDARPTRLFAHGPIPQIKRIQVELEARFPEAFDGTMRSRTRATTDHELNSWLHLNHLLLSGLAVEANYRYDYFFLAYPHRRPALERALRQRRIGVMCLNDGPDEGGPNYEEWLTAQLARAFPVPSQMELPRSQWRAAVRVHDESPS